MSKYTQKTVQQKLFLKYFLTFMMVVVGMEQLIELIQFEQTSDFLYQNCCGQVKEGKSSFFCRAAHSINFE